MKTQLTEMIKAVGYERALDIADAAGMLGLMTAVEILEAAEDAERQELKAALDALAE